MMMLLLFVAVSVPIHFCTAVQTSSDHPSSTQEQLQRVLHESDCPPWFHFNTATQTCHCFPYYGFRCFGNNVTLEFGICATYDEEIGQLSFIACPYFQSQGHVVMKDVYITLPENISLLNDYMCKPMNREGTVCGKCSDGYGPAPTSVGVQVQCVNCIDAWYGVPMYLLIEFIPVTIFYALLLIFRISMTSAPITCFIMYCQLIILAFDRVYAGDDGHITRRVLSLSSQNELLLKLILTAYDVWNLRFFYYFIPQFCISSKLKPIHLTFLGYISAFYPICLVFFTWSCIELHGRNFRPLVWIWRPFHRCFVRLRKGWDTKRDIIDVFASFFLLSYSKMMYQTFLLLSPKKITVYDLAGDIIRHNFVLSVDPSTPFGGAQHLMLAIPAVLMFCMFNLLPTLLLFFYPTKAFRSCLSKCRLDTIALKIFIEKYYGCYKDGLEGGRDMRSFASLYFFVRVFLYVLHGISTLLQVSNHDQWFSRGILFTITTILIALSRPYKKTYMNVFDTFLLAHLGLLCHLFSAHHGFSKNARFVLYMLVTLAIPLAGFILASILIVSYKVFNLLKVCHKRCHPSSSSITSSVCQSDRQPLCSPTDFEINYKTLDH